MTVWNIRGECPKEIRIVLVNKLLQTLVTGGRRDDVLRCAVFLE